MANDSKLHPGAGASSCCPELNALTERVRELECAHGEDARLLVTTRQELRECAALAAGLALELGNLVAQLKELNDRCAGVA